jgi:tetratricopeptide (TPR) repeat protein
VDTKYTPADEPAADAWLRLSGAVFNGYEAKLQRDHMKPWAELRIPPLERDLDALRKTMPPEVPLLRATNALAYSYLHAGRNGDAIKLAEEAIARQKANGWCTDSDAVASYGSMAKAVALAGRPELATEMSSAILVALKKDNPAPKVLASTTYSLGFAESIAGSHAEAEGHFREAVRLSDQVGDMGWTSARYKAWLGFALHDQKKYSEAEPVLKEAYSEWEDRLASAPAWAQQHPLLIAGRLASLYDSIKKPDEAAKWKALSEQK